MTGLVVLTAALTAVFAAVFVSDVRRNGWSSHPTPADLYSVLCIAFLVTLYLVLEASQ